jgi:hypothetical protein
MLGALRDAIDVPAFTGTELLVSSLILSTRIEKIETPLLSLRLPFTQGAYSVVPRTTQRYMNGEDLTIFFEVFGAAPDAQGHHHMDLAYQFYLEDRGAWLPVGSSTLVADQEETAQAWNVTLHGWPSGRYRVEVTVKDTLTGRVSTRGTYFDVAPGGEPELPPPGLSRS